MTALPTAQSWGLNTVFEEMSDGVILLDPAGQVCYRNKAIGELPTGLEERILSFCSPKTCGCNKISAGSMAELSQMGGWNVSCHQYGDNKLLLVKYDNRLGQRIQSLRDDFSIRISKGMAPVQAALETLRKYVNSRWLALGRIDKPARSVYFDEVYEDQRLVAGILPRLHFKDDFSPCHELMVGDDLDRFLVNASEVRAAGLGYVIGMTLTNSFDECVGYALIADEMQPDNMKETITLVKELALIYGLHVEVGSAKSEALKAKADATTDIITDQGNRRAFEDYIKECLADMRHELEEAEELSMFDPNAMRNSAMMVIDFDGFKRINDVLGHSEGDRALRLVAQALSRIPANNRVFRLGGDEFVQVFPRAGSLEAEDLRQHVNAIERQMADEGFTELGLSIGVVHFFESDGSLASLMALADARMYHDKRLRTLAFL